MLCFRFSSPLCSVSLRDLLMPVFSLLLSSMPQREFPSLSPFSRVSSFLFPSLCFCSFVPHSASDCLRRKRVLELALYWFFVFFSHRDGMGMLSYTYALRSEGRVVVKIYPSVPSLACSSQFHPGDVDVLGCDLSEMGNRCVQRCKRGARV
jgi:hypothetical protein